MLLRVLLLTQSIIAVSFLNLNLSKLDVSFMSKGHAKSSRSHSSKSSKSHSSHGQSSNTPGNANNHGGGHGGPGNSNNNGNSPSGSTGNQGNGKGVGNAGGNKGCDDNGGGNNGGGNNGGGNNGGGNNGGGNNGGGNNGGGNNGGGNNGGGNNGGGNNGGGNNGGGNNGGGNNGGGNNGGGGAITSSCASIQKIACSSSFYVLDKQRGSKSTAMKYNAKTKSFSSVQYTKGTKLYTANSEVVAATADISQASRGKVILSASVAGYDANARTYRVWALSQSSQSASIRACGGDTVSEDFVVETQKGQAWSVNITCQTYK